MSSPSAAGLGRERRPAARVPSGARVARAASAQTSRSRSGSGSRWRSDPRRRRARVRVRRRRQDRGRSRRRARQRHRRRQQQDVVARRAQRGAPGTTVSASDCPPPRRCGSAGARISRITPSPRATQAPPPGADMGTRPPRASTTSVLKYAGPRSARRFLVRWQLYPHHRHRRSSGCPRLTTFRGRRVRPIVLTSPLHRLKMMVTKTSARPGHAAFRSSRGRTV